MNLFGKGKAAPAPEAKAPAFSPIDRVGLLGLLDQIVNGSQSGVLELQEPRGNWTYAFQTGALTHASGGRVRGARQAFDLLWEFQAGQFMFIPGENRSLAGNLYIDKSRLTDLLRRSQAVLQGPSAPYIPPDQQRPVAPVPRPYAPPSPAQMPPAWQPGMQQPGWPPVQPMPGQPLPPGMPPQQPAWPQAYPQPYPGAAAQPFPAPAQPGYPVPPPQPFQGQFPPPQAPPAPLPPQAYPPVRGNIRPQVPPAAAPPVYPPFPPQQPAMPPQPMMPPQPPQSVAPAAPARPTPPPSFSVPPMPIPRKEPAVPMYQPQPTAPVPAPAQAAEPPKAAAKDDLASLRASLVAQAPAIKPAAPAANWNVRTPSGPVPAVPASTDPKKKGKGKAKDAKKKGDSRMVAGIKVQLIKFLLWACERRYDPDDHWTLKDAFEVSTMELRDQFFGAFSQTFASTKKKGGGIDDDMDDMAAGRMRGRARRH